MQGLIVLDGPDAAGKTTLANLIREHVGLDNSAYFHLTYVEDNRRMYELNYKVLFRAQLLMAKGKLVVMDRSWISENIYSAVYRGGSGLAYDVPGLDRVIMRLCGMYVLCCPSVETAVAMHRVMHSEGREMYAPDEQIAEVAQAYLSFYEGQRGLVGSDYVSRIRAQGGLKLRQDSLRYDWTVLGDGQKLRMFIKVLLSCVQALQLSQFSAGLDRSRPNFVGHLEEAKVLFVGDCCNPNKGGRWPFVDYGASSRVISQALHELKFDERLAVWTNANDDFMVDEILACSPKLMVIALGTNASERLERASIPHYRVDHPAYVLRNSCLADYVVQLRRGLFVV